MCERKFDTNLAQYISIKWDSDVNWTKCKCNEFHCKHFVCLFYLLSFRSCHHILHICNAYPFATYWKCSLIILFTILICTYSNIYMQKHTTLNNTFYIMLKIGNAWIGVKLILSQEQLIQSHTIKIKWRKQKKRWWHLLFESIWF